MSTTSNKAHTDFPSLIVDTTLTETLQEDQLTGTTGRIYSITITNGAGSDVYFAIYDSKNATAGTAQACLFRCDSGVDHTITSKTGIPINTALTYACSTNQNGSGGPSNSKVYISGS